MFVFGHLGFGHQLASPWRRRLPAIPLAIGMLLPDIIDKPLYYARFSDLITCTRTFGHSGLLCLALVLIGFVFRKRWPAALALGMVTHILLDFALDVLSGSNPRVTWLALTWPLNGTAFGTVYIASLGEHTGRLLNGWMIAAEIVGLWLVVRDVRSARQTATPVPRTSTSPS